MTINTTENPIDTLKNMEEAAMVRYPGQTHHAYLCGRVETIYICRVNELQERIKELEEELSRRKSKR